MRESGIRQELVESILTAIITNPAEHEVRITFRKQARELTLRARGVDHMLVNEFLQQNIVDEVKVFERDGDPSTIRDLLASLLFDCELASEVNEPSSLQQLEKWSSAVMNGNKILLH